MTQGNPGYGQQQPQPGGYGAPSDPYGRGASGGRSFNVAGAAVAVLGAIAVLIAYLVLDWFKGSHSSFSDIHKILGSAPSQAVSSLADWYFSWLGWVLLAVAAILAIAANAPTSAHGALRAAGAVVAIAGAVITFFAIKIFSTNVSANDGLFDYVKDARLGFYVALAGFIVVAIGALMGPRRV